MLACERRTVERVHGRTIWRFKAEVHGRPHRVSADKPEIVRPAAGISTHSGDSNEIE
jgi:hypothetical protein